MLPSDCQNTNVSMWFKLDNCFSRQVCIYTHWYIMSLWKLELPSTTYTCIGAFQWCYKKIITQLINHLLVTMRFVEKLKLGLVWYAWTLGMFAAARTYPNSRLRATLALELRHRNSILTFSVKVTENIYNLRLRMEERRRREAQAHQLAFQARGLSREGRAFVA